MMNNGMHRLESILIQVNRIRNSSYEDNIPLVIDLHHERRVGRAQLVVYSFSVIVARLSAALRIILQ